MTISNWIYKQLKNIYNISFNTIKIENIKNDRCFLCGGETNGLGLSKDKAISGKFTNEEYAVNYSSESVCESCCFLLKQQFTYYNQNKKKDSKLTFRNTSWIITPKITYPKLSVEKDIIRLSEIPNPYIIRNFILDNDENEFIILYSTSGQKHLFFRSTIINNSKKEFEVVFEDVIIRTSYQEVIMLLEIFESLLALGLNKSQIGKNYIYIKYLPSDNLKKINDIIYKYMKNPVFEFVKNISINQEDKTEWKLYKKLYKIIQEYMDLTQITKITHPQRLSCTQSIDQEIQKSSRRKLKKTTGEGSKSLQKKPQEDQLQLFD